MHALMYYLAFCVNKEILHASSRISSLSTRTSLNHSIKIFAFSFMFHENSPQITFYFILFSSSTLFFMPYEGEPKITYFPSSSFDVFSRLRNIRSFRSFDEKKKTTSELEFFIRCAPNYSSQQLVTFNLNYRADDRPTPMTTMSFIDFFPPFFSVRVSNLFPRSLSHFAEMSRNPQGFAGFPRIKGKSSLNLCSPRAEL